MELFPQDLGDRRARAVLLGRAGLRHDRPAGREPAGVGWIGRHWLGVPPGQPVPEEASHVLWTTRWASRASCLTGLLSALAGLGFFMASISDGGNVGLTFMGTGAAWVLSGLCWTRPRALVSGRLHALRTKPLSAAEVAALLPQAADGLERSYLTLVLDVVREEVSPRIAPGTDADLRTALGALGEAIDRLPATRVVGGDSPDIMTEVLRRTAERTLAAAQEEPDRVVAASLIRRVEALHRRADATARADVLTRRFSALRQEMAAETEALRAGLAAYYTGAHDVTDLTRLAEDVQRVAAEAAAITAAVEEVDALAPGASTRSYGQPGAPETRIQLGPG